MRHGDRGSDEDIVDASVLSASSDLDYDDGDFWSDEEEAGTGEERRGNTRGLLAPRPNLRLDPGLPPRSQGIAKDRHTRQQVRSYIFSKVSRLILTMSNATIR